MKSLPGLLLTTLLLAAAHHASAASSVDLTVKGLIVPSACTPGLSQNGMVDHGKVSAKDLNQDSGTLLEDRTLSFTMSCDGATLMAIQAIDNAAESSPEPTDSFGLGLLNGEKLGSFTLRMSNAIADGAVVQTIASDDMGKTWFAEPTMIPLSYQSVGAVSDATTPIPVQNLQLDLRVRTYIRPARNFDLSNEVDLKGSATLQVVYL
ncbi:hypothetical protein BK648_02830 [Pseudomonas poae]|uniref:DUF1120 domain-containing protein n=1 Tax=Pseudomonas poae TaxID=200451 RepID=A0A423FI97_9PSED|nr:MULTISPECIES: DUF1120 domain-containing protein [Pseudomonas]ROM57720.1 hypothetical protein BK648_02830 [Pseudomonas poae]TFF09933.1 DUF1120 domain-containing protein [Pseudomonas sp. JMN1]TFF12075.1 DUF1120 domain-containing protein [Pseudomonas sp. BCA17]TFF28851.1 DUF1120 domain-containing protein [Pseudomonas sp. BCA14]